MNDATPNNPENPVPAPAASVAQTAAPVNPAASQAAEALKTAGIANDRITIINDRIDRAAAALNASQDAATAAQRTADLAAQGVMKIHDRIDDLMGDAGRLAADPALPGELQAAHALFAKPGYRTSEFWLSAATVLATLSATASHDISGPLGVVCATVASALYMATRAFTKYQGLLAAGRVLAHLVPEAQLAAK